MKIPFLWAVYDHEYPDEGSVLVICRDSGQARRVGTNALGIPLSHAHVASMTVGSLLRRLIGRQP